LISRGNGDYLVTADNAQTLRFSDEQLRAQGRFGQGVAAISLTKGAVVLSASYLDSELVSPLDAQDQAEASSASSKEGASPTPTLLVVTNGGMVKKVPVNEFVVKGRATAGVPAIDLQQGDSLLLTTLINDNNTLLFASTGENGEKGERAMAMRSAEVKVFARSHRGNRVVGGQVVNVVVLG
jgi:DNA gyrase subunit A